MVAVRRTRTREDETTNPGVARGDEHVEKARGIGGMGCQRVFDRARDRTQRRLVQHDVHTLAASTASGKVGDVRFDERMALPRLLADGTADVFKVASVTCGEVVHARYVLVETQQFFEQVRTDEAGASRDEPAPRMGAQTAARHLELEAARLLYRRHSRHTLTPCARKAAASAWHFTSTYSPPSVILAT